MPKHEAMTPKAISNRIKSIGLQKLRWYCQMCQKQCRDENGFKCHTTSDSNSAQRSTSKKQHILIPFVSESHLRQMRLFAENPDQQIDEFSLEFERGFIEMLSYRHGTKRVQANRVYQEYIGDKHHIHMNSTIWTSLTEICIYLGKEGKATVDETEKGWFIQYIDRDPRLMAKQAAMDQRKVVEYDEEERTRRSIDQQIAAAALRRNKEIFDAGGNASGEEDSSVPQDFIRAEGADRIEISLGTRKGVAMKRPLKLISFSEPVDNGNENFDRGEVDREPSAKRTIKLSVSSDLPCVPSSSYPSRQTSAQSMIPQSTATSSRSGPKSAMEQIMFEEEKKKQVAKDKSEKKERTDNWLQPGIVVKIMNKKVGDGKYYKKKGVIISVIDKYVGELSVLDCNAILKLDQEHLETVIPKLGCCVMILNGYGRGQVATLLKINEEDFNCNIRIEGRQREKEGELVLPYEDISKVYSNEE